MGWDAFSDFYTDCNTIIPEFHTAAREVQLKAGAVDWRLATGGLDLTRAGKELADATGESVYDPDGWSADKVKALAAKAKWSDPSGLTKHDLVCRLSARAFLETCAALGAEISFSY